MGSRPRKEKAGREKEASEVSDKIRVDAWQAMTPKEDQDEPGANGFLEDDKPEK